MMRLDSMRISCAQPSMATKFREHPQPGLAGLLRVELHAAHAGRARRPRRTRRRASSPRRQSAVTGAAYECVKYTCVPFGDAVEQSAMGG